jgi:L-seryl-tRNA(Ser) seleniumtransferase
MNDHSILLRQLPKIDLAVNNLDLDVILDIPPAIVKSAVRETIESFRQKIRSGTITSLPHGQEEWNAIFIAAIHKKNNPNLQKVLNGTGVVIHTNLGRSVLGSETMLALQTAGTSYTNLEFDLSTGKRGSRYSLVEEIICDITGAEAALVVNNNAAAVLLALNSLAFGKEAIVSRGQLVEIGGSFRIPDIIDRSGATLVEVGATNRTHLFDYERAISEDTALLLKVHTSNFRVIGFTSEVSALDLVTFGREHGLPVMEDLGSGSLVDLSPWGLLKEPTVQEVVKAGVDVVTFSGDKLLGGPQAGLIVGRKEMITRIKKNPMNRALRIDKFTLASLESVLRFYYDLEKVREKVPTLALLTLAPELIKKKGQKILRRLGGARKVKDWIQLLPTVSKVGGGAMPEHAIPSWSLVLQPGHGGASELERFFRTLPVPLIGRIEEKKMVFDLRTILDDDLSLFIESLKNYLQREQVS